MSIPPTFPVTIEVNRLGLSPLQLWPKYPIESDPTKEVAPLVTADNYTWADKAHLRVRIIVFSSSLYLEPIIGVTNNNSFFYIQEGDKVQPDIPVPAPYNVYYFHVELITDYLVNEITVFNNLADPKTSRGTVTTVQSTTPPVTPPHITPIL